MSGLYSGEKSPRYSIVHDLFPIEAKPAEQDILQVEFEVKVFGQVGHLRISGTSLRIGLRGTRFGVGTLRGSGMGAAGGTRSRSLRRLILYLVSDKAVDLIELQELLRGLPDRAGKVLLLAVEIL